jgi:hypothetical protein
MILESKRASDVNEVFLVSRSSSVIRRLPMHGIPLWMEGGRLNQSGYVYFAYHLSLPGTLQMSILHHPICLGIVLAVQGYWIWSKIPCVPSCSWIFAAISVFVALAKNGCTQVGEYTQVLSCRKYPQRLGYTRGHTTYCLLINTRLREKVRHKILGVRCRGEP